LINYSRERFREISDKGSENKLLKQLATAFIFLLLWQVLVKGFFPTPLEVFRSLLELLQMESIWKNSLQTGFRVYVASIISLIIGVTIGVADYFNETVSDIVNTFFYPSQFVSEAVLVLIAIAVLGLTPAVVYIITVIAIVPNVFVTVQEGLEEIDKDIVEFGEVYTESKPRLFRHLIVPQILPYAMAGFLRAHAVAWDIVATTEIFLATSGLGYLVQNYYRLLDLPKLFATVSIIVVLGLVSDRIFRIIKQRIDRRYMYGKNQN